MKLPESLKEHEDPQAFIKREWILKNLVMKMIANIRIERSKPKMQDIVHIMKSHEKNGSEMTRGEKEAVLDKIRHIFGVK
jgi:hypothetical protein